MDKKELELLREVYKSRGFLVGIEVARILNIDHSIFHSTLYEYYRNKINTPLVYEYDRQINKYIPAIDPFVDPFNGMRLYGSATYGFREEHIDDLQSIFPNKKEQIKILNYIMSLRIA